MSERAGLAMGASLNQTLSGLIGRRVSIRLKDGDGFRDIVGILESSSSLINRHGEKIDFRSEEIAIWREVVALPDKAGTGAPLSHRIMELEALSNKTWPAPSTQSRGGWLYRRANGLSMRANSVFLQGSAPFGQPLESLDDEINYCINFYKSAGARPTIVVPLPIFHDLDQRLQELGWIAKIKGHFLVRDLPKESATDFPDFEFLVDATPSPEWLAAQSDEAIAEIVSAYPATYLAITFEDKVIATARLAVDGSWAIVTRLFVREEFRGRGLSKALMEKVSSIARNQGATKISLQVESTNQVALSLYQGLGYKIHHSFNYRAHR
jgi:GNAT superfamily N-acetyltransferase